MAKKLSHNQIVEKARKKCVKLAKDICKIKVKYKCAYCGRAKPDVAIHAHHIYNEGVHRSMSADVDNLISVCFTHHISNWNAQEPSFHRNPMEMADWFQEKYPERYKELRERSRISKQCDLYFWEQKLIELKKELDKLV